MRSLKDSTVVGVRVYAKIILYLINQQHIPNLVSTLVIYSIENPGQVMFEMINSSSHRMVANENSFKNKTGVFHIHRDFLLKMLLR